MLPRCLAAVAGHVDEIVDRRHRLHRPHRRDRRVVRREGGRASRGTARSPTRATSRSTTRPATGSSGSTPTRCSTRTRATLLRELASRSWREGFYLRMTSVLNDDGADGGFVHQTMRLFRNRPEYRFVGRIHEQHTGEMPLLPSRALRGRRAARPPLRLRRRARRASARRATATARCSSSRRPRTRATRSRSSTSAPSTWQPAAQPRPPSCSRTPGRPRSPSAEPRRSTCRRWPCRLVQALRLAGKPGQALATAQQAFTLYPDHTDIVREAALSARETGAPRPRRRARRAVPRAGRRARALRRRDRRRHVPRARPARLDPLRRSTATTRPPRCSSARLPSTRRSRRRVPPSRTSRLCAPPTGCCTSPPRAMRPSSAPRLPRRGPQASARTSSPSTPRGATVSPASTRPSASSPLPPRSPRSTACSSSRSSTRSRPSSASGTPCPCPSATAASCSPGSTWHAASSTRRPRSGSRSPPSEPSGPSLTGLARVAHARGLADDARALVEEALRLEPTLEEARTLREALAEAA